MISLRLHHKCKHFFFCCRCINQHISTIGKFLINHLFLVKKIPLFIQINNFLERIFLWVRHKALSKIKKNCPKNKTLQIAYLKIFLSNKPSKFEAKISIKCACNSHFRSPISPNTLHCSVIVKTLPFFLARSDIYW